MLANFIVALTVFNAVSCKSQSNLANNDLPLVDLGYAVHQGALNESGKYYSFRNIRFAEPPLGKYRFQPASPVITGLSDATKIPASVLRQQFESDPSQNEDCLFLDVVVPQKLFESRGAEEAGAAVMVWIYGGGYVEGSKDEAQYVPSGLLARSQEDGGDGVIYVALNYRLGLYGWLNGDGDANIFPNVALQDQLMALTWKYIGLFGGDPNKVTVFGESAGGGSIMHLITGAGGKQKAPFNQALIQSPGFLPTINVSALWQRTLETASKIAGRIICNGTELAALDQNTLFKINNQVVANSVLTTYSYGPTIDGGFIPDLPGPLLLQGRYDPGPQVMLGHNAHEGLYYVPDHANTSLLKKILKINLPNLSENWLSDELIKLYPPPAETDLYSSEPERASLIFSDLLFACNTEYLADAFQNKAWKYRFQVPPSRHGQDIAFTFDTSESVAVGRPLAQEMQLYFTKFAQFGSPTARGSQIPWPLYGPETNLQTFGPKDVGTDADDTRNRRCAYWQTGAYRGQDQEL